MNDAFPVGCVQRISDLRGKVQCVRDSDRPFCPGDLRQRLALDQFHGNEAPPVVHATVEHADDARMGEPGCCPCLTCRLAPQIAIA